MSTRMIMMAEMKTMRGKIAKRRLFKLDLRGRLCDINGKYRERAEWKIQTERRNKSKLVPGTNPQVSGFWIFFLLIVKTLHSDGVPTKDVSRSGRITLQ